ncbi:MAG: YkgJ family cysteine cluster protein [Bacteroidales bacterium]|jgi:Fe-S-cluster containining protein|nr:YkgJ family cysteine cluster protein [Bacteroidales bacterium]
MIDLKAHTEKATLAQKKNRKIAAALLKKKPKNLDSVVSELYHQAFSHIDCLDCANCCKSISPIVTDKDIQRIAKHLRMRPSELVDAYLVLDKEHDYVFRQQPCPFLGDDNYCSIYDVRPKACREYPHTDRDKFYQLLNLSVKNTIICPAVLEVLEGLEEQFKK